MWVNLGITLSGFVVGAFVNYLADVLPIHRRLAQPTCLNCGRAQPLLNYLVWPRRCPHCGRGRPWRVWLVELGSAVAFVALWNDPALRTFAGFWPAGLLLAYFLLVVVIDVEWRLILHPVSLFGALLALILGVWMHGAINTFVGAAAGYLIMLAFYFLGGIFARALARLRKQTFDDVALGYGDVNLTGVLGLLLGWPNILLGLLIAVFTAGIFSAAWMLILIATRRYRTFNAIPYGPFLIFGAGILLYLPSQAQNVLRRFGPLFWLAP